MKMIDIDMMDMHFFLELSDEDKSPVEKVYQYADELSFM